MGEKIFLGGGGGWPLRGGGGGGGGGGVGVCRRNWAVHLTYNSYMENVIHK